MQPTSLFALFGFAAAAAAAPTARQAAAAALPFEVFNLNVNKTAADAAKADIYFGVTDLNTNDTTLCSGESVSPNQIQFCNGVPQFVFSEDFAKLSVSWMWLDGGFSNHTVASGTVDTNLLCLDATTCISDVLRVPITTIN